MKAVINSHNKRILNPPSPPPERNCNCQVKDSCPMNGNCLADHIIYEAEISPDDATLPPKIYIGATATTFKKRYANHKKSFNHEKYELDSELSKEYWKIKRKNKNPKVTWKIVRKCPPFNRAAVKCYVCTAEKLEIALFKGSNILNKKSELISKCRHINKFCLKNSDTLD